MITIIWIAVAVIVCAVLLSLAVVYEPAVFDAPLGWLGRKASAWQPGTVILSVAVDSDGCVESLVYSGFVRNPGCRYSRNVIRRWGREAEGRGRLLKGILWECLASAITQRNLLRRGDALCFISGKRELCAVDLETGEPRWSVTIGADLRHEPCLHSDGSLTLISSDLSWLRVDLKSGSEVASGVLREESGAFDLIKGGRPMFLCCHTVHAVFGDLRVRLDGDGLEGVDDHYDDDDDDVGLGQGGVEAGPRVVVSRFSDLDATGLELRIESAAKPRVGSHLLDLSGRTILSDRIAVQGDALVFLSGDRASGERVELFAEVFDLERGGQFPAIRLGWGRPESVIDIAYPVEGFLALRIAGISAEPESAGDRPDTYLIDLKTRRVAAQLPSSGEDSQRVAW